MPPFYFCIARTANVCMSARVETYFFQYEALCYVHRGYAEIKVFMQIGCSRSRFTFIGALQRSRVKFIYKVLLTNKVYLKVPHISAKDANKNANKSKMKEGNSPQEEMRLHRRRRRKRRVYKKLSAYFNINLHSAFKMQDFDSLLLQVCNCMYVCIILVYACMYVSVSPRSIFHVQTDVL